jgi:AcrR family transcriptional regulator
MSNKRGEAKRALLMEATRAVVSRIGPRKTTLDDIAAEARVSRSTVYYHFASKGEVYRQLIDEEVAALMATMQAALDPALSPPERLLAYVRARVDWIHRVIGLYQVTTDMAGEYMGMAEGQVQEFHATEEALLASILREGAESGIFLLKEPALLASVLQGGLRGLTERYVLDRRDAYVEETDCLVRTVLRGIQAEPGGEAPC